MEITRELRGEILELKIEGRVDGYWADHLSAAVDQEIRKGHHHIQLDLSRVAFLSSAGIGALVRLYKDLKSIEGSFAVANCSPIVLNVLQLSKLEDILIAKVPLSSSLRAPSDPSKIERAEAIYELYPLSAEAKLECQQIGDASPLDTCNFNEEHSHALRLSDASFAIGLGALGEDFEDCKRRFGEFIVAGGAVAYLPTDGTNVPDFLLAHGGSTPEVQVCYGIACHGEGQQPFRSLVRFEAKAGTPISLTSLLESCLEFSNGANIGVVIVAEASSLIGAALRRSPISTGQSPFEFPRIRDWLSFTAEPSYKNRSVLVAGIAVGEECDALAPLVRPFPRASVTPLMGHFHAAAFSYRPLQRGRIDLKPSIKTLFEEQALEGILHLLTDDRAISGAGESEFVRGACWIGPISTSIAKQGASA